jgi:hypothetical protein
LRSASDRRELRDRRPEPPVSIGWRESRPSAPDQRMMRGISQKAVSSV